MKKWKRVLVLLLVLLLLTRIGFAFSERLKQAMVTFARTQGSATLSLTFQNALYRHLRETDTNEYITVVKDASDHITAIQIHAMALSLLASELTVLLLAELRDFQNDSFGIPLGNLTGMALLSGRGPLIPVKPVSSGNAANELQSTLESAGINQTLHRVQLHFVITVKYLAPIEAYADTIHVDLTIAETLVVGEVPILYRD